MTPKQLKTRLFEAFVHIDKLVQDVTEQGHAEYLAGNTLEQRTLEMVCHELHQANAAVVKAVRLVDA